LFEILALSEALQAFDAGMVQPVCIDAFEFGQVARELFETFAQLPFGTR